MILTEEHRPDDAGRDMLTVEDVTKRLKVSDSFVYAAIASGRLKHYRLGTGQGGIRISEEQLADFLRRSERGGEDASPAPKPAPRPKQQAFKFLPPS